MKKILKIETSVQFFPSIEGISFTFNNGTTELVGNRESYQIFTTKIVYLEASEKVLRYVLGKKHIKSEIFYKLLKEKEFIASSYRLDQNSCYPLLSNKEFWKAWEGFLEFSKHKSSKR